MKLVPAHEVAESLGVKTQTLGAWRRRGRGPKRWVYLSPTFVCYPEEEVRRYLLERTTTRPDFPEPPRGRAAP